MPKGESILTDIEIAQSAKLSHISEIAEKIGVEKVATGTTNPMIENGYIKVAGTKRVPVITYREVNVYVIGENTPEADKGE